MEYALMQQPSHIYLHSNSSKYPEFSKTPSTFVFWMILKVVMAVFPRNDIFFGTPCRYKPLATVNNRYKPLPTFSRQQIEASAVDNMYIQATTMSRYKLLEPAVDSRYEPPQLLRSHPKLLGWCMQWCGLQQHCSTTATAVCRSATTQSQCYLVQWTTASACITSKVDSIHRYYCTLVQWH